MVISFYYCYNHGVHLSGLSGRSQDLRLWGIFCQDCQDMRGKNDEKSRKSGYSGFPVSGVRIMSGYFDKFLPLPCLRKWSIPNLNDFHICWRSNVYEINWVLPNFLRILCSYDYFLRILHSM